MPVGNETTWTETLDFYNLDYSTRSVGFYRGKQCRQEWTINEKVEAVSGTFWNAILSPP